MVGRIDVLNKLSVEDEVLGNIRRLPLGPADRPDGFVADINLPLEFLRRVADRVIQASFRERWRVVVGGGLEHQPPLVPTLAGPAPGWVSVLPVRGEIHPPTDGGKWRELRPGVRGFRVPILGGPEWPLAVPIDDRLASAAKIVNTRLALDGIDTTVRRVADALGLGMFGTGAGHVRSGSTTRDADREALEPAAALSTLKSVGIPVDLWGKDHASPTGFLAIAENLRRPPSAYRVQLTGAGYYAGKGDGGSLDILKQLVAELSHVTVYVSVEERHASGVVAQATQWKASPGVRLVLIPEPFEVSQWARDNGISGCRPSGAGPANAGVESGDSVILAPRWAGRGEESGIFIPGESYVAEGWARAGMRVAQSPLLFEAGNLMVVEEARRRVLLLGEAEVWRNTSLGLTKGDVLAMFQRELGVQHIVVLPAASFHIDLELTVGRSSDGGNVAFVLDTMAAVRVVARLASRRLHAAGLMSSQDADACAQPGASPGVLVAPLGQALEAAAVGPGQFKLEFAKLFSVSEVDSGVGNLKRVLFACDYLAAELGGGQADASHHGAFLRSIRRMERDRAAIGRQLRQLGWKVVRVPGISAESVSINPLNGLWIGEGRFLLSAYGGFFDELDRAAAGIMEGEGFAVTNIHTGETQRRGGGLHCAVSIVA